MAFIEKNSTLGTCLGRLLDILLIGHLCVDAEMAPRR